MLIAPKINFIPHFFLEILQTFCKIVILADNACPCSPRLMVSTCMIVSCLSISSFPSFLKFCKDITNLLFLVFWACLAMTSKNDTTSLWKTCLSSWKKPYLSLPSYFGYFRHTWPQPTKAVASNGRKFVTFICKQKINLISHFSLQILHFTESCNLRLSKNILSNNPRTRI